MLGIKRVQAKVETVINDRVTQPITLSLFISLLGLTVAAVALLIIVSK